MANVQAIHSVGSSLATYLRHTYPVPLRTDFQCDFRLISSGEFVGLASDPDVGTTLSLYLYRVTINEHLRNSTRGNGAPSSPMPLSVDLHFLVTIWANSAAAEQVILAWAMRQLHLHPVLDRSSLSPEGGWGPGDVVHIIPAELTNEDTMRIWDALEPAYRLSVSYIARVIRIEPDEMEQVPAVVATNFTWMDRERTS